VVESEDSPYSLTPLPPVLRHGLPAVVTFGFMSFFSSIGLFAFLVYKLVGWMRAPRKKAGEEERPESPTTSDYNGFLVPDDHLCPQKNVEPPPVEESFFERLRKDPPNQFLVLILNLLLADIQQAMAFLLNVAWLVKDSVEVGSTECWLQGWFISSGDLASSVFITAIAGHTYLGIVQSYRLPSWAFYSAIGFMWAFIYGISLLGIVITDNGKAHGGFYTRAGAWVSTATAWCLPTESRLTCQQCWINSAYEDLRLHLHYLWIFLSLAITSVTYTIIFFHIRSLARKARRSGASGLSRSNSRAAHYPNPDPSQGQPEPPGSPRSFSTTGSSIYKDLPPIPSYARQQTFLLYPLIYVTCTVPIAVGRLASMAGNNVSLAYFCFAGSMIACNGWLDVLLYSTTRRSIVFSSEAPSQDTGIETFAFMRTPPQRKFGNVVFVSGGQDPDGKTRRWKNWSEKVMRNPGKCGKLKVENGSSTSLTGFGMGQGAVMGMAIQCETTTSVSVEENTDDNMPALSRKPSMASSMHTKRTFTG